jgi:cytochrome P450
LLHVITNPLVYAAIQAEIDAALSKVQRPVISDSQARNLPYLQAVIKEGLRIFPPATGLFEKQTPPEGDTIDGRFVPGGTRIAFNVLAVQRDKKVFGEDAQSFRPERWLDNDKERVQQMEKVQDLVFGYGRYGCLGKSVALIELNKVFFEVRNCLLKILIVLASVSV